MPNLLNKVAGWPLQDTAVGFYRIVQPLRFLHREGYAAEVRTVPFSGEGEMHQVVFQDRMYMEMVRDAEVFWTTLLQKPEDMLKALNLRKWSGCKLVIDIDDNWYAVSQDNPAHDMSKLLRSNFETALSMADGVTVSVPMLKSVYERLNENIYVFENGIDFSIWDKLKKNTVHKGIRIGWEGAHGHMADLNLVAPAIEAIKKKYDVTFVTMGVKAPFSDEHHEWVTVSDYPEKLASLNLDIALAPLVDSAYNRCKSNLRWLEFSALKVPVIYSPTENQKGLPGIAARTNYDWYEALESLILDRKLRISYGGEQYEYARQHFNPKKQVAGLSEWFANLPRRSDLEPDQFDRVSQSGRGAGARRRRTKAD